MRSTGSRCWDHVTAKGRRMDMKVARAASRRPRVGQRHIGYTTRGASMNSCVSVLMYQDWNMHCNTNILLLLDEVFALT